jgi:hypothetical protein
VPGYVEGGSGAINGYRLPQIQLMSNNLPTSQLIKGIQSPTS